MYFRIFTLLVIGMSLTVYSGEVSVDAHDHERIVLPDWNKTLLESAPPGLSEEEKIAYLKKMNPDTYITKQQQIMLFQLIAALFRGEINPEIINMLIINNSLDGGEKKTTGYSADAQISLPEHFIVPLDASSYFNDESVVPEFEVLGQGVRANINTWGEHFENGVVSKVDHIGVDFLKGKRSDQRTFLPLKVKLKAASLDHDYLVERVNVDKFHINRNVDGKNKKYLLVNIYADLFQQAIEGRRHVNKGVFDEKSFEHVRRSLKKMAPLRASLMIDMESGEMVNMHYRLANDPQADPEINERYRLINDVVVAAEEATFEKLLRRLNVIERKEVEEALLKNYHLKIGPLKIYSKDSNYAKLGKEKSKLDWELSFKRVPHTKEYILEKLSQLTLWKTYQHDKEVTEEEDILKVVGYLASKYKKHLTDYDRSKEFYNWALHNESQIFGSLTHGRALNLEETKAELEQYSLWKTYRELSEVTQANSAKELLDFIKKKYSEQITAAEAIDVFDNFADVARDINQKKLPHQEKIPNSTIQDLEKHGAFKPGILKSLENKALNYYKDQDSSAFYSESFEDPDSRVDQEQRKEFEHQKNLGIERHVSKQKIIDRCRKKPTTNRCVTKKEDILKQYECILNGYYYDLQQDPPHRVNMRMDIQGRLEDEIFTKNKVMEYYYRPDQPIEKEVLPGLKISLGKDEIVHLCLDFAEPAENSIIQLRVLKINRTEYKGPEIREAGTSGQSTMNFSERRQFKYPYKVSLRPANFKIETSRFEGILAPVSLVSKLIGPITKTADLVLDTVDISGVIYKEIKSVAGEIVTGSLNQVRITPPSPSDEVPEFKQGKAHIQIGGGILFGLINWKSNNTFLALDTSFFEDDTPETREAARLEKLRQEEKARLEEVQRRYYEKYLNQPVRRWRESKTKGEVIETHEEDKVEDGVGVVEKYEGQSPAIAGGDPPYTTEELRIKDEEEKPEQESYFAPVKR